MSVDDVLWLQAWFLSQCDGSWEHECGIVIETLDNPGWSVRIDLNDTPLADQAFLSERVDRGDHDWLFCEVREGQFRAACGPANLLEVLRRYRLWADPGTSNPPHLTAALAAFESRKRTRTGG